MSADQMIADRIARRRAEVAAARPLAALLASMPPLSENRRVRICGMMRAAEMRQHGAVRIQVAEIKQHGLVPRCPDCGHHTRKVLGHRPDCIVREGYGE